MSSVSLTDCIAPSFYSPFHQIIDNEISQLWLPGGRGSCKSSFIGIGIPYLMMQDAANGVHSNAVCLRKIYSTCKDSVFAQLLWAINMMGVSHLWEAKVSPLSLTYKPTGQQILFRGSYNQNDFQKIKSIKFTKGSCKYVWYEELSEFAGMDEVRQINASLLRGEGSDLGKAFYSYNPPPNKSNWVNTESLKEHPGRLIHHTTYLDVPPSWLGKLFIEEAEFLKVSNFRKYEYMYLGVPIGEGLEIYPNVEIRTITDEEIKSFDDVKRGLDFGYSHASCYSESFFDRKKDYVYVFDEVYSPGLSNDTLVRLIYEKAKKMPIRADNEDPRTINELITKGLNIIKTRKGKDSKPHGIKWLSDRTKIIVDKKRCPNITADLLTYEKKKDKEGKVIHEYPEEPDGSASVRYGLEDIIIQSKVQIIKGFPI